ncbi:hypothetical protein BH11PSE11_BH11PSE11_14260 [soil metagenome]
MKLNQLLVSGLIGLSVVSGSVFAQQEYSTAQRASSSQEELDQLLAPIALYPDSLLSQVLMAATYPLEVVQAARFLQQNPSLQGNELARAVDSQDWDASVKTLVEFPDVLTMLDANLAWTQRLGDAFLAEQEYVMDTVQSLRARARTAGTLQSNEQQRVLVQDRYIIIEPPSPQLVYVPYYDPTIVYGSWWWPSHPPMVWRPTRYRPYAYGSSVPGGIAFSLGIGVGHSFFRQTRTDWQRRSVYINAGQRSSRQEAVQAWRHNPEHRRGVTYRNGESSYRGQVGNSNTITIDGGRSRNNSSQQGAPSRTSPATMAEPVTASPQPEYVPTPNGRYRQRSATIENPARVDVRPPAAVEAPRPAVQVVPAQTPAAVDPGQNSASRYRQRQQLETQQAPNPAAGVPLEQRPVMSGRPEPSRLGVPRQDRHEGPRVEAPRQEIRQPDAPASLGRSTDPGREDRGPSRDPRMRGAPSERN